MRFAPDKRTCLTAPDYRYYYAKDAGENSAQIDIVNLMPTSQMARTTMETGFRVDDGLTA